MTDQYHLLSYEALRQLCVESHKVPSYLPDILEPTVKKAPKVVIWSVNLNKVTPPNLFAQNSNLSKLTSLDSGDFPDVYINAEI